MAKKAKQKVSRKTRKKGARHHAKRIQKKKKRIRNKNKRK
jgi:hypothetical protein